MKSDPVRLHQNRSRFVLGLMLGLEPGDLRAFVASAPDQRGTRRRDAKAA